jgi:hypothetical protein
VKELSEKLSEVETRLASTFNAPIESYSSQSSEKLASPIPEAPLDPPPPPPSDIPPPPPPPNAPAVCNLYYPTLIM